MGFGKVGSEVARRGKGLGMHVITYDPYAAVDRAHALGIELVSFDEALSRADFISLHMPLTPDTDKLFNAKSFAKVKRGVRIINVARGGVIDEDDLLEALESGVVAQVKFNVYLSSFKCLLIFYSLRALIFVWSHVCMEDHSFYPEAHYIHVC